MRNVKEKKNPHQLLNRLQNSRFRSFWKARSAVSVILEGEAREPHTPAFSPQFSLAVFTLAPDLLFEYGPSVAFAKNTAVLQSNFSKAFDTIKYKTVLKKLNYLGFSKYLLNWNIEYLTDRWHFVQVDDKTSDLGVPQGSTMGPLILNLYVADLHAHVNMQCHQ